MTLSGSIGQCTTNPPTGMSGFIFTALQNNPNNGMLSGAFIEGDPTRNLLAALIESIARGVVQAVTGSAVMLASNANVTGSIY